MTTSLVTGGAGFMGSHVAEHLVELGHRVIVVDDLSGGFRDNVPAGAEFVEGSILDHRLIDHLFEQNSFDYVYHLAAYAAEGLSHFIKRFNYNNNLIGSINLINAAVNHNVKCFVFTSSIAVYGAGQSPMSEAMIPVPEDSYGIAKLAVEQELTKLTDHPFKVSLGEVTLERALPAKDLQTFSGRLQALGFELLDDQRQKQIEKIKNLLITLVQKGEMEEHFSLSTYLGRSLQKEYTNISRLFSEVEGMTIEQYFILLKVEKVKEWLVYDELTLGEIAWKLGYSSTAHLSAQFKKVTGLTPSHFKRTGNSHRTSLDKIV